MKLLRVDFPPDGAICAKPRCPRKLKQRCYVVKHNGKEVYLGSTCVKDYFDKATIEAAPDLTRRDLSTLRAQASSGRSTTRAGTDAPESSAAKLAAEYLWLRLERIASLCADVPGLAWSNITPLFDKLKAGNALTEAEVNMVLNTAKNAPPNFSAANLLDVYTALWQLNARLDEQRQTVARHRQQLAKATARNDAQALQTTTEKLTKAESYQQWLEKVKAYLGMNLGLTPKQLAGARLTLSKSAFAWYKKETG